MPGTRCSSLRMPVCSAWAMCLSWRRTSSPWARPDASVATRSRNFSSRSSRGSASASRSTRQKQRVPSTMPASTRAPTAGSPLCTSADASAEPSRTGCTTTSFPAWSPSAAPRSAARLHVLPSGSVARMRPGSSASSASCTHDASSTPAAASSAAATLFSSTEPALIMDSRMPEAASRRSASRWARIAENAPASWTERYCATASSSSESSRRMG